MDALYFAFVYLVLSIENLTCSIGVTRGQCYHNYSMLCVFVVNKSKVDQNLSERIVSIKTSLMLILPQPCRLNEALVLSLLL